VGVEVISWPLIRQIRHIEKGKSQKESCNQKPASKRLILLQLWTPGFTNFTTKKKNLPEENFPCNPLFESMGNAPTVS
jgi:hypothetical protein